MVGIPVLHTTQGYVPERTLPELNTPTLLCANTRIRIILLFFQDIFSVNPEQTLSIFYLVIPIIIPHKITRQKVNESLPEVPVKNPVYDRVQHGVRVSQPQSKTGHPVCNMLTSLGFRFLYE